MKQIYHEVLDTADKYSFNKKKDIKKELESAEWIDAIKLIKNYEIASPRDYLRACGKCGWTDFYINKLKKRVTDESKYIISRRNPIDGKTIYLQSNNLQEIVYELEELINKGCLDNAKEKNRVKGYFKGENELIIGNNVVGKKKFILEKADINSIVKRKRYIFNKNHDRIEAQIGAVGLSMGMIAKIAKNDKNKTIDKIQFPQLFKATMKSIKLQDISEESYEKIDLVDVVLIDENHKRPTIGIEVELSGNIDNAMLRLTELSLGSIGETIGLILTEKAEEYYLIKKRVNFGIFNNLKMRIGHMNIQDFISILKKRDAYGEVDETFFWSSIRWCNKYD